MLAFGESVALPTRLRFNEVPPHQLPRGKATNATVPSVAASHDMRERRAGALAWRQFAARRGERARVQ